MDKQNINGNYANFGILQICYHIHIFNHVFLSLNSYLYRFTTQRRVSKQDVWFPSLNSVHELDYSKLSNQHTECLSSISLPSLSLHFYPSRFINYIVTHSKSLYCSISLFFLSLYWLYFLPFSLFHLSQPLISIYLGPSLILAHFWWIKIEVHLKGVSKRCECFESWFVKANSTFCSLFTRNMDSGV